MTLLFQKGPFEAKLRRIVQMALTHARNLAVYAAAYKALLAGLGAVATKKSGKMAEAGATVLSTSGEAGRPRHPWHAAVAGGVGGYLVWGSYSGVNYQVPQVELESGLRRTCRNFLTHHLCVVLKIALQVTNMHYL